MAITWFKHDRSKVILDGVSTVGESDEENVQAQLVTLIELHVDSSVLVKR